MDRCKHLGLRIDIETHRKLKFLARYEDRSINREVLSLIKKAIMEFEKAHGRMM